GFIIETFVFTKDAITNNGIVAVALNNKNLHIATDYSFNWTPIGKHMTITKAVKNQVFEIDGISAVDIYEKYMSKELAMRLPQIGIEFPLILERHGVEIGRAVLEKREDGSLIFAGNVNENDKVRFGIGNVEMIIRDSHYHARQLQEHPIESIFIYSCMARRRFVGTTLETELRPLQEMGPTSGFFTYGEFYHSPEAPQLLNETMTILALSESSDAFTNYIKEVTVEHHFGINPLHVISHLANTVTKELEELNGDLEQRVEENTEYILEQVYTDRLTKLPNRLKLIEQLPNFVGHYLILININDFTELNDFYGHYAGDTILEEFAQTLFHLAKREQMEVFKLPADEYALMAKNDDIQHYIEYLFNLLNNFIYHYQNNHIHINITMAAAQIYGDGHALANTDMSLKLAKRQSENFLIFEKDMMLSERYKLNLEMASSIRHALNHNQIVPYYQPIIDVKTGKVDKHECLARLIMPEGEVISPIHFLERSQKIRLYFEITKSIITTAFKKFQNSDEKFSINLSINDILNNDIKSFIFEKIQEYDVGKQLTFEILETQALENDDSITEFIYKAKRLGVSIAVDDFGSGFANFQHITKIDVDVIKIDGSLIRDISKDKNARVVVETIVSFAQKLGLKTVAEYVESPDIYHLTKELGIDY
ncbi:MAG: EAL domain-containing protein, partial [Thiovulaceae bacterium]|nr:EAL domain-containing protein [Sulfurimonadaceae bacterium]